MDIILGARAIVLVVTGPHKKAVLQRVLASPPTPDVPASYLQGHHDAVVVADMAAWPA
jgi:glucosamine-6-phosphate deaminase